MKALKTVKLFAFACAISGWALFSAGCAYEVDDADQEELVAETDDELGIYYLKDDGLSDDDDDGKRKMAEQDHDIAHGSGDDARAMEDGDNCLNFEALMDPDPVSWRPDPTTGKDDSGADKE